MSFPKFIVAGMVIGAAYAGIPKLFAHTPSETDICVDQAMQSEEKVNTAVMAAAFMLKKNDQGHLIKHMNTRDAVAAVYCKK